MLLLFKNHVISNKLNNKEFVTGRFILFNV